MMSSDIDDGTHHLVRDRAFLTDEQKIEAIVLTPPMVLASALMYLMLAEGEIGAADGLTASSGFVTPLLQSTKAYVHAVPFQRFLQDAPALLTVKERLSVLVNVCDGMISDGNIHEAEKRIFDQLTIAFGIKPQALETFLEAITAKNNKAALGDFDASKLDIRTPSPHLGLGAALVQAVMAPDGSVRTEDVDRLNDLLGEYEGLLEFSLDQAPAASPEALFETLGETLNRDQKLFVLTNVFEAMHKEGELEAPEKKSIFQAMRSALGFTENAFKPIVLALKAKSAKSAATRDHNGTPILQSVRSKFARKPLGYAQSIAASSEASRSNVVQVDGRSAIHISRAMGDAADMRANSAPVDTARASHRLSQRTPHRDNTFIHSRPQARSHSTQSTRSERTASSQRSAQPGLGNRASARTGAAIAFAQAQARATLVSTRKQMEQTRAANAEIRARMDQPYDPRKKSTRPKAVKPQALANPRAKAQAAAPRTLAVKSDTDSRPGQAAVALHFRRAQPLAGAETGSARAPAHAVLNSTLAGTWAKAVHRFEAKAKPASAKKHGGQIAALQGADFSDPGLMWRFALPVVLLAASLLATDPTGVLNALPARAAAKVPCWLGSALLKPPHAPQASVGCWSTPRLGVGNGGGFADPTLDSQTR
jgi:uncharacterized tellurite resistance protein B-like protein